MANLPPKIRWAIFFGIALLAFAVRVPKLGERPMHTDESINAYITGDLLAGKPYQYDPKDRHGPVLYAIATPIARLTGARNLSELNETSLRLTPVLFGALTILLFGFLVDAIGFAAAVLAALLFALGPLPVYYSRDFIHETLFVAATFATLVFGFRLLIEKSVRQAIGVGVGAALMLGCKETAVIHFAAFVVAAIWWLWAARKERQSLEGKKFVKPLIAAGISFCFVTVLLFTWFGRHWSGLADLFHAAPHLTARAGGEGHEKPDWYYLALLGGGRSGAWVLALAVLGIFLRGRDSSRTFLGAWTIYTVAILAIYSLIPYKTPWLALGFFLPLTVLAGNGFVHVWQKSPKLARVPIAFLGIALFGAIGHDTWRRVFVIPADESNPYAYAQTVDDILRAPERIEKAAARNPAGKNVRIAVIAADPWPLPWYLRQFPNVGFWQPGQDPGKADIYITSPEADDAMAARVQGWRPMFFGVRPEVLMTLWLPPESEPAHE